MWIARAIGASENFNGEVIRPSETFVGNLAVFFGTSSLNSIWQGSSVMVRGVWRWDGGGEIFTPYKQLSFNERTYISLNAQPPFGVEFLVNANIRDYSFSIWEKKLSYKSNTFAVNVSEEVLILPQNTRRDSVLIINQGSSSATLSFDNGLNYSIEIEPGYSVSFEPGTLDGIWGKTSGQTTSLKVIEVTKE